MTSAVRLLILLGLIFKIEVLFAQSKLTVYTYPSFLSEWGPGAALKKLFEQECGCTLHFMAAGEGAALISKLKLEGSSSRADVILGVDNSMVLDAIDSHLFHPLVVPKLKMQVKIPEQNLSYAVPFDFGLITVM